VSAGSAFNDALDRLRLASASSDHLKAYAKRTTDPLVRTATLDAAEDFEIAAGVAWGELVSLADADPFLSVCLARLEIEADREGRTCL